MANEISISISYASSINGMSIQANPSYSYSITGLTPIVFGTVQIVQSGQNEAVNFGDITGRNDVKYVVIRNQNDNAGIVGSGTGLLFCSLTPNMTQIFSTLLPGESTFLTPNKFMSTGIWLNASGADVSAQILTNSI